MIAQYMVCVQREREFKYDRFITINHVTQDIFMNDGIRDTLGM